MTRVMAGLLALFYGCLLVLLPLPVFAQSLPNIPGLPSVPGIAKIDIPFGSDREVKALYTISGSTRNDRFKPEPCTQGRCSNFELADAVKLSGLSIKGRQWVDKHQLVPGGKGFLASVNNGLEPTGLVPWGFGVPFKLVAEEINEDRGEVRFALYTRVCVRTPLADFGCTPFFIGPIPIPAGAVREGGEVLIATSNPPPVVDIPPDLQAKIDGIRGIYVPEPGGPLPVGSADGCLIAGNYKEVDLGALGRAIALIESQGQANNGYGAVGTYVIDGPRRGRALGRYQFMSYDQRVQKIVKARGGSAWLAKVAAGYKPTAEEVARYFPEAEQERLMADHLKGLIDRAMAEGYTGDRLIARVAEMHNAGEFSRPGVAGGYASQAIASYKTMAGKVAANANCNPNTKVASRACKPGQPCALQNPLPGSVATSEFGVRWGRLHAGLDIASGGGKPVLAAWDGTMSRGWNCPNEVFITLTPGAPGGAQFVRILHSSTVLVRPGQQVKRGQTVAREGSVDCGSRSTGPHVHLEIGRRVQWGAQVNPRDFAFDPPLPPRRRA